MRVAIAVVATLLLTMALAMGALLIAVFDRAPLVTAPPVLTATDIEAMRSLLSQVDPRTKEAGLLTELGLREQDIEQLLNYGLGTRSLGHASLDIEDSVLQLTLSVPAASMPLLSWLNVRAELVQQGPLLQFQRLQFGNIALPAVASNKIVNGLHGILLQRSGEYSAMVTAVDHLTIGDDELKIGYRWQPRLYDQLSARGRELLLPADQLERLQAHAMELAQLSRSPQFTARLPLTAMLAPMLQFAERRGGNAVEENRAALQILAMYVMNVDQQLLLGQDEQGRPQPRELRLAGQRDFAQHFLVSAALAITTDAALTAQMGLRKEMQDAEAGGSGFSFPDLAVDQAGARFGELAVRDAVAASQLQQLFIASSVEESLFVPTLQDLPLFATQAEFSDRFTAIGSPEYNAVVDDIERRINALPLYQSR